MPSTTPPPPNVDTSTIVSSSQPVNNPSPVSDASDSSEPGGIPGYLDDIEGDAEDEGSIDPQFGSDADYNSGQSKVQFEELHSLYRDHCNQFYAPDNKRKEFNDDRAPELLPKFETRTEYNAFHRAHFRELRTKAAVDDSIPNSLFDPPRSFIQVRVAKWPVIEGHFCCPCDLDEDECQAIEIRSTPKELDAECKLVRSGVTKDLFLQKLSEAFYGKDVEDVGATGSDSIEAARGHSIGGETDRPFVQFFTMMLSGGAVMGHIFAMTRGM